MMIERFDRRFRRSSGFASVEACGKLPPRRLAAQVIETMKVQQQLEALERLADALCVRVSYEPMTGLVQGTGGLCRVRGQYRIIIDRRLKPPERVQILVEALRRFDTNHLALEPEVQQMLTPARVAS
jgi:hypothetical protein